MTREEAILWMRVLKHSKINWVGEKAEEEDIIKRCEEAEQEAFDMAIEALKAEPNTSNRSDLIRRGDVKKAICEVCLDGESLYKGCKHHWNCPYLTKIWKIPTVSADAVQGEWIEKYNGNGWNDFWDYTCSACGKKYERADAVLYHANYCPNCGARMTKGGDTE